MAQVPGRVLLNIIVQRASNLPKTDRIGHIDPYVVINMPYSASCKSQKTKTIDNDPNPQWREHFLFELDEAILLRNEMVTFEIFDSDTFKDEKVAVVQVPLSPALFVPLKGRNATQHIPISFLKDKWKHPSGSFLEVTFSVIYTFETLSRYVAALPGVVINNQDKRLYVPLPPQFGQMYVGIEYEKSGDKVDVKIFDMQRNDHTYIDLAVVTEPKSRVRRRKVGEHFKATPISGTNLAYYEEVKLDDVPIEIDWMAVTIWLFDKKVAESMALSEVVTSHGWAGSLTYPAAKKKLHGVTFDDKSETIYFPIPQNDPTSYVLVDYDKGNVDMKVLVVDHPVNTRLGYDLSITGVEFNKKTSDIYVPPKDIGHQNIRATRRVELDDVPYNTPFHTMLWEKLELTNQREIRLGQLIKLGPF
ncbi:hypothetical protein BC832DRAFT_545497 [Gaertneriomyces semiglobifer]|nr:hypothetical protein BC832DRAFT_545497 [Gaertneriomyces semiglobifer]